MAKHNSNIFRCEHCKAFKVCLAIFQHWRMGRRIFGGYRAKFKRHSKLDIRNIKHNNWKDNAPGEKLLRFVKTGEGGVFRSFSYNIYMN